MNRQTLAAVSCLAIAACGQADGGNDDAGAVAPSPEPVLSSDMNGDGIITVQETEEYTLALIEFEPGLWRFQSTLDPVDPSLPGQIIQMLRQNVEFIRTECVTDDSVPGLYIYNPGMPEDQVASMVQYQSYALQDGELSSVANISMGGMDQISSVTGTLAPGALMLHYIDNLRIAQIGSREIRVAYTLAGQRVGDC